jgi:hypothetical protein
MRKLVLSFALLGTCLAADPPKSAPPRNLLTNEGVLLLAEAGLGERFLLELIEQKTSKFDTSAEALAAMARQGLTENILRALVKKQDRANAPGPSGSGGDAPVALEPHLLRGKVVRQRMLVPDAAGGNVGIMTMAPVPVKPTAGPAPAAEKRDPNADRWYLITQR